MPQKNHPCRKISNLLKKGCGALGPHSEVGIRINFIPIKSVYSTQFVCVCVVGGGGGGGWLGADGFDNFIDLRCFGHSFIHISVSVVKFVVITVFGRKDYYCGF